MISYARHHRDRDCNMADLGKVVNTFFTKKRKKIKSLCYAVVVKKNYSDSVPRGIAVGMVGHGQWAWSGKLAKVLTWQGFRGKWAWVGIGKWA